MPVLEKEAKYNDYVFIFPEAWPRIEAAINYAREQGNKKIVLIAHSCSVHMTMTWIAKNGDKEIDAFVGIGMGATDYKQPMLEDFPLEEMSVPVLDIYGADDYPAVHRMAPERIASIQKAGNPKSAQVIVPNADHYFKGQGGPLVEEVSSWLDTL
jgi:dienelactone hydrolase